MSRFRFLTGSYTEEDLFPGSRGEGIRIWELDSTDGSIASLSTFSEVSNSSWVAVDPTGFRVAVASEHVGGRSKVCLVEVNPDGSLNLTHTVPAGDATCHIAFSPDGNLLASAAYMGGEVQLMQIEKGRFIGQPATWSYEGSGPNPGRQEAPHAHHVLFSPDSRQLYVTDLGTDRIWCHRIENGKLPKPPVSVGFPPGEGPRHLVVDWDRFKAFALAELTGTVHLLGVDRGSGLLTWRNAIPSLPAGWKNLPSGAAIRRHPTRPLIYASHRNGGLIAGFRIDEDGNQPVCIGIHDTADPTPRDFNISPDGGWLVVAGQETHRLYVHPIDRETGRVGPVHCSAECGSPVCVEWMPGCW
jgi:6-phosphogluconolactonase